MASSALPTELNWVKVRAECILPQVFIELHCEVQKDVEIRQAFVTERQRRDYLGFVCEQLNDQHNAFVVHRNGANIVSKVDFRLEGAGLVVRDRMGQIILTAKVSLSDEWRCMLTVDGRQLEHWQVRKRALEDLFFNFDL